MMNKNVINLFLGVFLFVGLLASPVHADLGLQQTLSSQGVKAFGAAVRAAAEAVYAGTDDPTQIQSQLVAILNEAEATGSEAAMRYAIVAVMVGGGEGNLEASIAAINNSNIFANHPNMTALTVTTAEKLIRSGGGAKTDGKKALGGGGQGGDGGGGASDPTLGGGDPDVFDPAAGFFGGDINDHSRDATQI